MLYGVAQACSIRDRRSTIRDAAGADMLYGVGALAFRGAPGADVGAPCHPSRERVRSSCRFCFIFSVRHCDRIRVLLDLSAGGRGGGPAESGPDATAAAALAPGPGGQLGERRGAGRRRRYAFGASATVAFAPRRPSLLFWVCPAPLALDSRIVACLMLLAAPRRFPSAVAVQVAVQSHARGGPAARVMSSRRRR
jgi:hypothetical protein